MKLFNKTLILKLIGFMLPMIIFGAFLGALPGYKTYEYVWKDAGFCLSCHVHDYANHSWEDSSHGKMTTCHDCHHQPLHKYIEEAYIQITKQPKFPKDLHHTPNVPKELCQTCHVSTVHDKSTLTGPLAKEDLSHLPKVDQMYLHKVHLSSKTNLSLLKSHSLNEKERMGQFVEPKIIKGEERMISCSDCHGGPSNRAHNFTAVDVSCVRCHDKVHNSQIGKQYGCRNCHFQEFLLPTDSSQWSQQWHKKKPMEFLEKQ